MGKKKTPIAVFTYNRVDHVRRLLDSLQQCAGLEECDIRIYCDGPKNQEQVDAVEESRKTVRQWAAVHGANVVERQENLGLARSIVMGVTELCEKYGRVIVVEDDFVLSPDFIDYMLKALDKYERNEEVHQISGFMFSVANPDTPDAFFLPVTTTWGWATWARAWKNFDWDAKGALEKLRDYSVRRRFNLGGAYSYSTMLERRLSGKNDSWGILWWWKVFEKGGIVLHPRKSLVWVGGFDNTGTHCSRVTNIPQDPCREFDHKRLSNMIVMPNDMVEDYDAFERIKLHLKRINSDGGRGFAPRFVRGLARRFLEAFNV